jgi:hypothetical protein
MTGAAAAKATDAADELLSWLSRQPARSPAASPAPFPETVVDGRVAGPPADPKDRPPVVDASDRAGPSRDPAANSPPVPFMRLPTPDWLHHRLTITGPAAEVGRFRQAAAGAGIIPWHLDLDRLEEEYFHLLVAPDQRSLSVAGARIFAHQLREAVARRHDMAVSRVGRTAACPFDLHALLPVPDDILRLGPDDPQALAWLWINWGTTEALRYVGLTISHPGEAGDKLLADAALRVEFWSADWTPWRALMTLRVQWPALRFDIRPTYEPL